MRLLFVGGSGTLSSACARLCVLSGHELTILVRGTRDHRIPAGARVLHGDVRTQPVVPNDEEFDCVVDFVAFEESHVRQDVQLFAGRTRRYVFVSSTSVYRKPLGSPLVGEDHPIGNAGWEYAQRKADCETYLLEEYRRSGFPAMIVRPGYTYADFTLPTGIAGLGFGAVRRILSGKPLLVHGDGTGWFPLTHHEDFARAFVPLLGLPGLEGEVVQIASGEHVTWLELYRLLGELLRREVDLVFAPSRWIAQYDSKLGATLLGDKAHSLLLDLSKLRRLVPGLSTEVPLREGLRRALEWYRANGGSSPASDEKERLLDRIVHDVQSLEGRTAEWMQQG